MQRDLVERAAAGDQKAFEALVRQSGDRLFAIASRILNDHGRAEDALQQTLITIWDELPRLRDPDRFEAWTYRVIVRASTAMATRERRGGPIVQLLPDDAAADTAGPIARDEIDAIADRDQVRRGFRRLTPDQRAILVLQHYVGLSLSEIAEVLGIPVGTAGSRLHYAAQALRASLEADERSFNHEERTA